MFRIVAVPAGAGELLSATRYDAEGRVTDSYDAAGYRTHTEYDGAGRRSAVTPPGSVPAAFTLNPRGDGLVFSEEGSLDTTRRSTYSLLASGLVEAFTDGRGKTTRYLYDGVGRKVRTTLPDLTFSEERYDALGRREYSYDAEQRPTQFGYDAAGRLSSVKYTAGQTTRYSYNELGWQVRQIDALGRVTHYEHDDQGRRTARLLPDETPATLADNPRESFEYDLLGNLQFKTDFNGETTEHRYDEHNRLVERIPDAAARARGALAARFTYTADGQRESQTLTDAAGTTAYWETYRYDGRGRLQLKRTPVALLRYTYDARSNLRSIASLDPGTPEALAADAVPTGVYLVYGYDADNRLASAEDRTDLDGSGAVRLTGYRFNAVGSLECVELPNGIDVTYGYDAANRLRSVHADQEAQPLARFDYDLRPGGHRWRLTERIGAAQLGGTPRITTWTYDAAYRLASESITAGSGDGVASAGSVSYGHNGVGNRQHRTVTGGLAASLTTVALGAYTYDVRDRIRTAGASSFGYDENGSTTSATNLPAAEPLTRTASSVADTYDHDNRLLQRTETGPGGRTITLLYDADGNRVRKTVAAPGQPTRTTWYVVDTLNPTGYAHVIEEHEQIGNGPIAATKLYAYGHDLIGQHVWVETPATLNTPATSGWHTRYHGYDGHGSVRYLTTPSGAITDTYTYDAYGILLVATSTGPTPTDNTYLYAGEQWDPDLGLYYNRARYLDPETGRFWSKDDYEGVNTQPATLHKYLYAHADPVNGVDPSGRFTLAEMQVVTGEIATLTRMTTSVLRVAHTAKNAMEFLATLQEVSGFVLNGDFRGLIRDQMKKSTDVVKNTDVDSAIESLLRHAQTILSTAFVSWTPWLAANYSSIDRYVIYMPNAPGVPYFEVAGPRLRSVGKKIVIGFGSGTEEGKTSRKAGRLTGLGVGLAGSKHSKQVWRMDVHRAHDLRGDGDLGYFEDWPYHYHISRPN